MGLCNVCSDMGRGDTSARLSDVGDQLLMLHYTMLRNDGVVTPAAVRDIAANAGIRTNNDWDNFFNMFSKHVRADPGDKYGVYKQAATLSATLPESTSRLASSAVVNGNVTALYWAAIYTPKASVGALHALYATFTGLDTKSRAAQGVRDASRFAPSLADAIAAIVREAPHNTFAEHSALMESGKNWLSAIRDAADPESIDSMWFEREIREFGVYENLYKTQ